MPSSHPVIPLVRAEALIPPGPYCYTPLPASEQPADGRRYRIKPCPFWSLDTTAQHGPQNDGYCGYLKRGDWEDRGASLLWDQVKECRIKVDA